MNLSLRPNTNVAIRPLQYRDLDAIERLIAAEASEIKNESPEIEAISLPIQQIRRWYGPLKFFSLFPNPFQYLLCAHVAQQDGKIKGMIQISPFNRTRSTWRVDRIVGDSQAQAQSIGSQLLRHCLEAIWEARTWLLEVNVNNKTAMALYRQNGFQALAKMTYWAIGPEKVKELADREPDLPNLLPVSNADAQLLYQLDTASMPPLVRQVFDRHIHDFKTSFLNALIQGIKQWISKTELVSGYVFEPQRKAAIGYFQLKISRIGAFPCQANLTVHPAYTWLYPELLSQMARIAQDFPPQSLHLNSADYQQEREEYLEQIGADRISHTLLMSRSVWHKLRESKRVSLEGLQLPDVLQGLQPAHKPVAGRMSWISSMTTNSPSESEISNWQSPSLVDDSVNTPNNENQSEKGK